jgi:hypothetical protein
MGKHKRGFSGSGLQLIHIVSFFIPFPETLSCGHRQQTARKYHVEQQNMNIGEQLITSELDDIFY